jgi:glycosyltransferase involved in cell wall biosynthesis
MTQTGLPQEGPTVALVHDYFTQRGGAERVAARLAALYPDAPLYTSVVDEAAAPVGVEPARVRTTGLQRVYSAGLPLKALAPALPAAFGRLDLDGADVVISSSSAFAHHVRPTPGAVHLCYCHTPPQFLWNRREYFGDRHATGWLAAPALHLLRRADFDASGRVDVYVANSRFTAERIRRSYGREARVVYPPIETESFVPSDDRSGRFLVVARLRPHKALSLAIAAANEHRLPLDVIGEGSGARRLKAIAGPSVRFLGHRSDAEVAEAMARCVALVVPGIEDFGMATAEVQAAGRPAIGLATGGTKEIVDDGETGFLVTERTVTALGAAMMRARREELDRRALLASARRFDVGVFNRAIEDLIEDALSGRRPAALRPYSTSRVGGAAAGA